MAKSLKIGNVFIPQKSRPGRQLNAASRKSLEIQNVLYRKTKNPFQPSLCLNKGV